jgi:SsrA-binding protein
MSISNKSAYHEFFIEDKYDAGLVLMGTEVKSLRAGRASFNDSYCYFQKGELWIKSLHIAEYSHVADARAARGVTFPRRAPLAT